jgi:2-amino-4-hydroxy-6-hydroxymethyldihydropteridine diphosphokinase
LGAKPNNGLSATVIQKGENMKNRTVYVSVGSNLGNKLDNCQKNIDILAGSALISLKEQSPFYKTEPVDYTDQDWFVNAVIKIETDLDPFQLLNRLKSVEHEAGRTSDTVIINSPELTIPHPRMHKRCFVLRPLCDIAPDIIHPVLKKNMKDLLDNINAEDQKVLPL